MPDDNTTPVTTTLVPTPGPEPTVETFSLEYVQGLRSEAAKYRNEKKTAVEQAQAAKDVEWQAKLESHQGEVTRLGTDLGSAWIELAKLYATLDAEVPTPMVREFAGLIQGSDAETIKGSAESARKLLGAFPTNAPATDPTQGSGSGVLPLNGDPILAALKHAVGAK